MLYENYLFSKSNKKDLSKKGFEPRVENYREKKLYFVQAGADINKNICTFYIYQNEVDDLKTLYGEESFEVEVLSDSVKSLILRIFKMYTILQITGQYIQFLKPLEGYFSYFFIDRIEEALKEAKNAGITATYANYKGGSSPWD